MSNESFELLKQISEVPIPCSDFEQYSSDCLEYLCKNNLICEEILEYNTEACYGTVSKMEYRITDLGKGYLVQRQEAENVQKSIISQAKSAENLAKSAKETANSASRLATTAASEAKFSSRYAKISLVLSIIAILISGTDLVFKIFDYLKILQ